VADTDPGHSPTLLGILAEARDFGFLGPGPLEPQLRHAEGFLALARRLSPAGTHLLDLGSGGGLPGLVMATGWPDASLTLLDANQRRTTFLLSAVDRLGLQGRVAVVHERAEVAGRDPELRGVCGGVVARSFGPPAVVAECAAPFLAPGGWLIVSEPPGAAESPAGAAVAAHPEVADGGRWPASGLSEVGLVPVEAVAGEFGYQILRQDGICPERFPRRNGVPTKHPLF